MNAIVSSEARVPVIEDQEVDFDMLTNMGIYAQGSIDNLIAGLLGPGIGYSGCALGTAVNAQSNAATIVTIGTGFMKRAGKVYPLRDATTIDLASIIATIPAGKTAQVVILADGQETPVPGQITVLDQAQDTGDPNAQVPTKFIQGATAVVRSLVPDRKAGDPGVQPDPPAYPSTYCLLGTAIVDNGSIASVTQSTAQQAILLDTIAPLVLRLNAIITGVQSAISSLNSSVAANTAAINSLTAQFLAAIADIQAQINALKSQASAVATSIFRGQDNFQNLSQSNPSAAGYNAVVSSGLRFGTALKTDTSYAPQTPFNAQLQRDTGSFLLPAKTDVVAAQIFGNRWLVFGLTDGGAANVNMGNIGLYTSQTFNRYFGRQRTRMSQGLPAGSAAQVLQSGDPSQLFGLDGSGYVYDAVNLGDWRINSPSILHLAGFWNDVSAHGFWTPGGAGLINGLPLAVQPYTPSTSGMVTEFDVTGYFPIGNNPGAMRVLFCADNAGQPDFSNVYADVSAALSTSSPDGTGRNALVATLPFPVPVRGGRKYHIGFAMTGAYGITLDTADYRNPNNNGNSQNSAGDLASLQNDYMLYINGSFAAPAQGRCIAMTVKMAQFASTTVRVDMQPLTLAGGFDTIDLLAHAMIPDGCQIGYEAYAGAQYVPLSASTLAAVFAAGPQSLPIRMVLQGTTAQMPVIDATAGRSTARCSKGSAALDHISAVQTPSGTVTRVHKSVVLDGWVGGSAQTLTADLMPGPGFSSKAAPDSAPNDILNTDGSTTRSWTWTIPAAPSFEMELVGALANSGQPFVVRQSNWDAGN